MTISLSGIDFVRLGCGRATAAQVEAAGGVVLTGDAAVGRRVLGSMTVDVKTATYTNSIGATELIGEWTDPSFDPNAHATYYARVLEIPTPRWSTYWAAKLNLPPNPNVAATVQQRAWTSPVWYTPAEATK